MTQSPAPLVEFVDVAKIYPGPPNVQALRGVSLTIHTGTMTAIVGPSGSGKSTLLNMIGLLDKPDHGVRRFDGLDTSTFNERRLTTLRASRIGFVFQAFHLVPYLDCVTNVTLPLIHQGWPRRDRRRVAQATLEQIGLAGKMHARPTTLSGGEQQRVAIARALVHSPVLLLCDEPTGNLDTGNTDSILALLRQLVTSERAIVVVTHDPRVQAACDHAVAVEDGRVSI